MFGHTGVVPVIAPGAAGIVVGVIVPVVDPALAPQVLFAVTDTVPAPEPTVIVAEVVVPPAVTDHPVPVTDHVYEVAPLTAEILKIFPAELAQIVPGCVIEPGVAGVVIPVPVKELVGELLPEVVLATVMVALCAPLLPGVNVTW